MSNLAPFRSEGRNAENKMEADDRISPSFSSICEEVDVAECNLVCCKFKEASSISHAIIQRFCDVNLTTLIEDDELNDVIESAGMVFIQSQRELGRTSEILDELKFLFGSVGGIPGQLFLAGVCIQIAEGFSSKLKPAFEEFLAEWKYMEEDNSVVTVEERITTNIKRQILSREKYLDIFSVYAVNLLGMELKNVDLAVSWTEKTALPEEKRQEILRKLQSLSSAKNLSSSSAFEMHQSSDKTLKPLQGTESFSAKIDSQKNPNLDASKATMVGYSRISLLSRLAKSFWWIRGVRLNYRNITLTVPFGKILLWCSLVIAILHIFRKKQNSITRFAGEKFSSIKRVLFDAWQLAFSVQVNPLAAIQPVTPNNAPGLR